MAKYDAMGDKVQRRVPVAVWIMLVGLVVGVVGLIWCLTSDLKKYAKTENLYTDQNKSEVRELDFELDSANVDISPSSDEQIHVSIENAPEGIYSYGQKDGKFYIHRKGVFSIFRLSGIANVPFLKDVYPEAKIRIELPSMALEKVEIDASASDVTVNGITCEKLYIDNGMGKLKMIDCAAEKSEINNGMGKMEINYCSLGKTDIDNGMGSINMKDCVLEDSELDNGMGAIDMSGKVKGDMDIDNGMGEVDLKIYGDGEDFRITGDDDNVDVKGRIGSKNTKYKIHVDNGMGDVDIDFRD